MAPVADSITWSDVKASMVFVIFVGSILVGSMAFGVYVANKVAYSTHCADPILVNSVLNGLRNRVKEVERNSDHMMNLKLKGSLH